MNSGGSALAAARRRRDAVINAVFYAAGAAVLFLIGWGLWRMWDDAASPTLRLRKDQWVCTGYRTRQFTVVDGRYGHTQGVSTSTCVQYSLKGG
jgi:hypothetical protein